MAGVQFSNVTKRFGDVTAVDNVVLDIGDREFMVLLGPSGCGKSTLLRMVAGLEEPTEGEVWIGDKQVNGVAPKERDIAMVFQSYALYPHKTVQANIEFPLKARGVGSGGADARRAGGRRDARAVGAAWTGSPASSRAASASGWRSRAPSSATRRCSSWTSRSPTSTPSCGERRGRS